MKKSLFFLVAGLFLFALIYGTYHYFRTTAEAVDVRPTFEGTAADWVDYLKQHPEVSHGAVIRIQDRIEGAGSRSLTFPGQVIATKDTADTAEWPSSGTATVQGRWNGVEVDAFFGDTLYRLNGCFLLEDGQSGELN